MSRGLVALASGLLFGAGLALSGMLDPARVRGFLDLFGAWRPGLALVIAGAVGVMIPAWVVQRRMERAALGDVFDLPGTTDINARLAVGAILFGVGWGLAGLCPGPVAASLAVHPLSVAPFALAMVVGMAAVDLAERAPRRRLSRT